MSLEMSFQTYFGGVFFTDFEVQISPKFFPYRFFLKYFFAEISLHTFLQIFFHMFFLVRLFSIFW